MTSGFVHMPLKPFKIIEVPPDPPSFNEIARKHHLSRKEKAVIQKFALSVRHGVVVTANGSDRTHRKSARKSRSRSGERAAARKK